MHSLIVSQLLKRYSMLKGQFTSSQLYNISLLTVCSCSQLDFCCQRKTMEVKRIVFVESKSFFLCVFFFFKHARNTSWANWAVNAVGQHFHLEAAVEDSFKNMDFQKF